MNGLRPIAALAAIITALLLQGTVIGPVTGGAAVSLPAVLVAAVAAADGPAAGLSIGFVAGLLADLGSNHPAGLLALTWLLLGVACGVAAPRQRLHQEVLMVAGCCAVAAAGATLLFALVHVSGASLGSAIGAAMAALVGDAVLAVFVVPPVRAALRSHTLRAPHPSTPMVGSGRHG